MTARVFTGRLFPVLALLLLALSIPPASAQSGELTLEAFWARIESVHTGLSGGDAIPADRRAEFAGQLDSISAIRLPDGTKTAIDTSYLAGLVRDPNTDIERARAILAAALAARDRSQPGRFGDAELAALAGILAGDRFQWAAPEAVNPLTALWHRFLNWAARVLSRFWPGAGAGQVLNALLITATSIALAVLLRYVYLNAMRSVVREADLDPEAGVPANLTAEQAARRARARAVSGDLRDAVRYLYLASLYRLEERGDIRLDRTHTNRELIRDLANRPELSAGLRAIVETFDRVWYGYRPISEEEYERFNETVQNLK